MFLNRLARCDGEVLTRSGTCVKLINGDRWVDTSVYRQILLGCGFWVVFLFKIRASNLNTKSCVKFVSGKCPPYERGFHYTKEDGFHQLSLLGSRTNQLPAPLLFIHYAW